MQQAIRLTQPLLLAALAIAYALLAHFTNANAGYATIGTLLALAPIACILLSIAWHSACRAAALLAVGVSGILLAMAWDTVSRYYGLIYWAEHAGTQLFLLWFFGRTLQPGREPLCSGIARLVHGSLTTALADYTRRITAAWTVFFGLMAATSTLLFFGGTLVTWSWFANFMTAPLIASMFVAEYAVRRHMHPDMQHVPILAAVRLFWKAPAG